MKYFLVIILFITNNSYSQLQWQNPLPQGNFLTDITFADSLNGYACGYAGTIVKSNDSGNNWEYIGTNHNGLFKKLTFPNIQNGWALCYYTSSIYKTDDFGNNWYQLSEICDTYMNSLEMVNDSIGYACGPDAKIYKTIDGGINWFPNQSPIFIPSLFSIDFVNENVGYCGGDNPYLLKTTDGGSNWTYLPLPLASFNFCIYDIQFKSENFGYICGFWEGLGFVLLTSNGGNTWTTNFFQYPIHETYFENMQKGWVRDQNGLVYSTTNGGTNWNYKLDNCTNLYFFDENHSWSIFNLNNIKFSNDGWNSLINQTTAVTNENLIDIAIRDSSSVFVTSEYNILGTTNTGITWQILLSDSSKNFSAIKANNENEIWAVGNSGLIVYSFDNGDTWNEIQLNANRLSDIYFLDSLKGYIIGKDTTGGKIFETTNGGNTWNELTPAPVANNFNKILFSNNMGWISSSSGLYRTIDFGANWTLVKSGSYFSFSVYQNSVWIPVNTRVLISFDFGSTWQEVQVYEIVGGDIRYIRSIDFINENVGWVCVDDGRIYKTSDAGLSWTEEQRISGIRLNDINFLNENLGWVVGIYGSIIHYGDIVNNINEHYFENIPHSFQLYQNYPNPFNSKTIIRFELDKSAKIKIDIFDITGTKVCTIAQDIFKSGKHELYWNGSNLQGIKVSSGLYFCRLITNKEMKTIKMVLLN